MFEPSGAGTSAKSRSVIAAFGCAPRVRTKLEAPPKMIWRSEADDEAVAAKPVAATPINPSNTNNRAGLDLKVMVLVKKERQNEVKGDCILIERLLRQFPDR